MRFRAFEIFATPTLFLASDFISRTSDEVQARRAVVFFLVGILSSLLAGGRLLTHEPRLAMDEVSRKCGAGMLGFDNLSALRMQRATDEDAPDTTGRVARPALIQLSRRKDSGTER